VERTPPAKGLATRRLTAEMPVVSCGGRKEKLAVKDGGIERNVKGSFGGVSKAVIGGWILRTCAIIQMSAPKARAKKITVRFFDLSAEVLTSRAQNLKT
jgi:hypothetical protein